MGTLGACGMSLRFQELEIWSIIFKIVVVGEFCRGGGREGERGEGGREGGERERAGEGSKLHVLTEL